MSEYVDQDYRPDPEEDALISSGLFLKNGMKVLIGASAMRSPSSGPLFHETNRWCTVKNLCAGQDASLIVFTGVYDDGTEAHRCYHWSIPWLVKKDTYNVEDERHKKISEIMAKAFLELTQDLNYGNGTSSKRIRDEAVDEILKLF